MQALVCPGYHSMVVGVIYVKSKMYNYFTNYKLVLLLSSKYPKLVSPYGRFTWMLWPECPLTVVQLFPLQPGWCLAVSIPPDWSRWPVDGCAAWRCPITVPGLLANPLGFGWPPVQAF